MWTRFVPPHLTQVDGHVSWPYPPRRQPPRLVLEPLASWVLGDNADAGTLGPAPCRQVQGAHHALARGLADPITPRALHRPAKCPPPAHLLRERPARANREPQNVARCRFVRGRWFGSHHHLSSWRDAVRG